MQARIIFGGPKELTDRVQKLYEGRFMNRHFIHTDSTTAEFIKYMNNINTKKYHVLSRKFSL